MGDRRRAAWRSVRWLVQGVILPAAFAVALFIADMGLPVAVVVGVIAAAAGSWNALGRLPTVLWWVWAGVILPAVLAAVLIRSGVVWWGAVLLGVVCCPPSRMPFDWYLARRRERTSGDGEELEELTDDEVMELAVSEVKAARAELASMTARQRRRERRRTRSLIRRGRLRLFVRHLTRRPEGPGPFQARPRGGAE